MKNGMIIYYMLLGLLLLLLSSSSFAQVSLQNTQINAFDGNLTIIISGNQSVNNLVVGESYVYIDDHNYTISSLDNVILNATNISNLSFMLNSLSNNQIIIAISNTTLHGYYNNTYIGATSPFTINVTTNPVSFYLSNSTQNTSQPTTNLLLYDNQNTSLQFTNLYGLANNSLHFVLDQINNSNFLVTSLYINLTVRDLSNALIFNQSFNVTSNNMSSGFFNLTNWATYYYQINLTDWNRSVQTTYYGNLQTIDNNTVVTLGQMGSNANTQPISNETVKKNISNSIQPSLDESKSKEVSFNPKVIISQLRNVTVEDVRESVLEVYSKAKSMTWQYWVIIGMCSIVVATSSIIVSRVIYKRKVKKYWEEKKRREHVQQN